MKFDIPWRLPEEVLSRSQSLSDILSWDYQIYFSCNKCQNETRFDRYFGTIMDSSFFCPFCRAPVDAAPFKHELMLAVSCRDCGYKSRQATLQFRATKSAQCLSGNVDEQELGFSPEFSNRFGDGLSHATWGVNIEDDENRIIKELEGYKADPEQVFHLLTLYSFSERLRRFSYAGNLEEQWKLLNIQGSILRDYFRRTHVVEAGRKAVQLFESSASFATHTFARAMIEHNVAMAIYSLPSVFDIETTSVFLDKPDARSFALDLAERAQGDYARTDGLKERLIHIARVDHLMGDILSVGISLGHEGLC